MSVAFIPPVVRPRVEGMALPEGNLRGGNCGVTAVAIATGRPFNEVWDFIKKSAGRRRWNGSTSLIDRFVALKHFGVYFTVEPLVGKPMLQDWIRQVAIKEPNVRFMVTTCDHVQIVKGTSVIDQCGLKDYIGYRWKRKHVINIMRLG